MFSHLKSFIFICLLFCEGLNAASISAVNQTRLILKTADKIAIYEGGNEGSQLEMAFMLSDGSPAMKIGKTEDDVVINCPGIIANNDSTLAIKLSYNCTTGKAPPTVPTCKPNFILLGRNCYQFNTNKVNWYEALYKCQSLGATLAHPMDVNENTLLKNFIINTIKQDHWWLGGTDVDVPGQWIWGDSGAKMTYFDWNPGAPHNGAPDESCLIYWTSSFKWEDHNCRAYAEKYICQH